MEAAKSVRPDDRPGLDIRTATARDAAPMWRLVRESGVLEVNSAYAYVLLCDHFADTCLVAWQGGQLAGFVAAYRPPVRPEVIFVWQIGVAASARGQGLGSGLLDRLVALPAAADARYLEATVTPSNAASQRLFSGFARRRAAPCVTTPGYPAGLFPNDDHEAEELFRIGPLQR